MPPKNPLAMSPAQFEEYVKTLLDQESVGLEDYESRHLDCIVGVDADYVFDVTARFTALGVNFTVLIECKRWSKPIERELVQVLAQKKLSVGAQKAMLVSTAPFRKGAVEFAKTHGIALAQIKDGSLAFHAKSESDTHPYDSWLPNYSTWLIRPSPQGTTYSILGSFASPFGEHESSGYLLDYFREA